MRATRRATSQSRATEHTLTNDGGSERKSQAWLTESPGRRNRPLGGHARACALQPNRGCLTQCLISSGARFLYILAQNGLEMVCSTKNASKGFLMQPMRSRGTLLLRGLVELEKREVKQVYLGIVVLHCFLLARTTCPKMHFHSSGICDYSV